MRTCNVLPAQATCSACLETQEMFNVIDECDECECRNREYEIVNIGSNFWGSYAIVVFNGKPEKVALRRIVNIKN